jgi:hypothetical protein
VSDGLRARRSKTCRRTLVRIRSRTTVAWLVKRGVFQRKRTWTASCIGLGSSE